MFSVRSVANSIDIVDLLKLVLSMTIILETYTVAQTLELTGFKSVAMLDYLQRTGVFSPRGPKGARGRGRKRRYSFRDLLVLKAINRLLDSGASVANLKTALEKFQKLNWTADPVTMEDKTGIVRFLIASAGDIYLARDADALINLSKNGQLAFSFIIDLEHLRGELREGLKLPPLQHEFVLSA